MVPSSFPTPQAIGKNKRGKKGGRKKVVDPMTRKDWYDVKAPAMFSVRNFGKTTLKEIKKKLNEMGLDLGMEVGGAGAASLS